jgi:hypothetical protein
VLYLVEQALGPEPREPDGPLRGERLGALRLVLSLADTGLDADAISEATGLDRERIVAALAARAW